MNFATGDDLLFYKGFALVDGTDMDAVLPCPFGVGLRLLDHFAHGAKLLAIDINCHRGKMS